MTLAARHRITYSLFFISLIINGALLFLMIAHHGELSRLSPLSRTGQNWWFDRHLLPESTRFFLFQFSAQLVLSFGALIISLSLFLLFKRSSSQEIFYFQLFLLCLSLFSLRLFSYPLSLMRMPFSYTVLLCRSVLFFRFGSLLFLLLTGLSVFDSRFQKSDPFFLSALLIALSLAATIPMSDLFIGNTLTYQTTNELNLFFLFIIVETIIPLNFLWFFYQRKTADYLILTLSTLMVMVAENFTFYLTVPGSIAGLILLLAGSILFSHRIYRLYLWR